MSVTGNVAITFGAAVVGLAAVLLLLGAAVRYWETGDNGYVVVAGVAAVLIVAAVIAVLIHGAPS